MVKVIYRNFVLAGSCVMNLDYRRFDSRSLRFVHFNILKNSLSSNYLSLLFKSESGCKDKMFFRFLPNLFQSFFKLFFIWPRN